MFKTSREKYSEFLNSIENDIGKVEPSVLSQFCHVEEWALSKATGLVSIGPLTEHKFGIPGNHTGLLKLLSRYGNNDRLKLASFFERAAESAVTFTHSAQICLHNGIAEPITIIGKSDKNGSDDTPIKGIFIFPKKIF